MFIRNPLKRSVWTDQRSQRTLHEREDPAYRELTRAINLAIRRFIEQVEPTELREALQRGTLGGKRIRPIMTMLSAEAVGGSRDEALPAAVAIELLHTSSLVHDDIMDCANTRRGFPSIHSLYGNSMAILAGDTLVALAFRLMQSSNFENKERVMCSFTSAFLHVCEGQGYDLILPRRGSTQELHRTMVEKKTAFLMEAAAGIGAMIGTMNEDHIQALSKFGFELGLAFQAKDDVLDVTGDRRIVGKPIGADRRNGKRTFLSAVTDEDGTDRGCSVTVAVDKAQRYTHSACDSLEVLPPTPSREQLRELAEYLLVRKH